MEAKDKFILTQEKEDLMFMVSNPQSRRYLYKLLAHCGVYLSSFDPSGSKVYYNEGMRSVGLHVIAQMEQAVPDSYIKILAMKKELDNV